MSQKKKPDFFFYRYNIASEARVTKHYNNSYSL